MIFGCHNFFCPHGEDFAKLIQTSKIYCQKNYLGSWQDQPTNRWNTKRETGWEEFNIRKISTFVSIVGGVESQFKCESDVLIPAGIRIGLGDDFVLPEINHLRFRGSNPLHSFCTLPLSLFLSHTHTHTLSLTLTFSHSLLLSLTRTLSDSHSLWLTHTLSPSN